MNRSQIETVRALCREVERLCTEALIRLDAEVAQWNEYFSVVDPLHVDRKPSPSDRSFGSRETDALRRRSMDLTCALADLRGLRTAIEALQREHRHAIAYAWSLREDAHTHGYKPLPWPAELAAYYTNDSTMKPIPKGSTT